MDKREFTVQDFIEPLRKRALWIVLISLICAAAAWLYTVFYITPIYTTRVTMCVFSGSRSGSTVTSSELSNDARLANTYKLLLTSQPVLNAVSEKLDGKVSPETVGSMLSCYVVSDSQLINVYIRSADPYLAVEVGEALFEAAPETLREIARGGEMEAVNHAVLPKSPTTPDVKSNVLVGFLIGLGASCAAFILISLLDTTVWSEESLQRVLPDVPVLGCVPGMNDQASGKRGHGKRR